MQADLNPFVPGAGAPAPKLAGRWRGIGSLGVDAIEAAVCIPLEQKGIAIEKSAVEKIVLITQGHPFFIQVLGFYIWLQAQKPTVTLEDVRAAYRPAVESMIEGIFNVRYDRLTPAGTEYVNAMARLGCDPYRTSDVAKAYGSKTASKIRESLNKKGMIFSPKHDYVDFTIPLFAKFLTGSLLKADV